MKKIFTILMTMMFTLFAMAQTVTLKFTGTDINNLHCQLDHVTVTNITHNWQETLYWPDTTLILNNGVGVRDYENLGRLKLSQNTPNH